IGNYKVTLFENKNMKDGDKLILNGPGFFNLTAWATEDAKDKSIFDDKTEAVSIESNTQHPSVLSNVPGYQGLVLLRGDLHSHTLWSDAYWGGSGGIHYIQDPCQTFRIYQDLGYDFAGVSDHVFGADKNGSERYSVGAPRSIPGLAPKYAMTEDEWENTEKQASKAEHNYNFASIAGYEYGLGGVSYEQKYIADNDYDMVAHYNVFCSTDFYYGKPDKWDNNSNNRKDFYQWASNQYEYNKDLIVQFNHPSKQGAAYNDFDSTEAVDENNQPINRAAFSLCELLTVHSDGEDRDFFDAYVKALNNGWKVGPTATSDNHDGIKALKDVYKNIRTVVAVEECSKNHVLDALRKRRVYATTRAGLNIGFSITNSDGQTVIMGGDINSLSSDLNICIGLSGDLESDEITAIKLYTNVSAPISLDITKSWPMLVNCKYLSNRLEGLKYIFVVVETKEYNKQDPTQKYGTFAAATAPIWIID
ncbi:MAG TPA: hypothetical protein VHT34_04125, partial [Clostridia bacterium]|nr:hypothetical protein [Clostridia bacterium]